MQLTQIDTNSDGPAGYVGTSDNGSCTACVLRACGQCSGRATCASTATTSARAAESFICAYFVYSEVQQALRLLGFAEGGVKQAVLSYLSIDKAKSSIHP